MTLPTSIQNFNKPMRTSKKDQVREMYESTADAYNNMMDQEIQLPVYRELLERLHQDISGLKGPLLDAACGSGHMLAMYMDQFDATREVMGVDLSARMVEISKNRLGNAAKLVQGDMQRMLHIESASVAAVINFFAIHHLDPDGVRAAMREWNRVLVPRGRLLLAAWEGSGPIDYGDASDLVALRYGSQELLEIAGESGYLVPRCRVAEVQDFPMKAIYLECQKPSP